MKNLLPVWLLALVSAFLLGSCVMMSRGFVEPKNDDSLLVIGSVAIDLFEYRGVTRTYRSGVKVIIAGRHKENNRVVHKNYWLDTDARGYFFLANVPRGDYALRGFRIQTFGPSYHLTVMNPLHTEKDQFRVVGAGKLPEAAFVFQYPARHRIVNLRHNYFIIDRGEAVHQEVYYRLNDLRLVTGKTLLEPDVLSYFRQKYPQSSWFKE